MPEWKCETCNKVKDLSGPHLKGKTTVRSDCWPCAKKRTFILVPDAVEATAPTSQPVAAKATTSAAAPANVAASPFASAFSAPPKFVFPQPTTSATNVTKSPFGAPAAATKPPAPGGGTFGGTFGGGKTGNPFLAAAPTASTNPFSTQGAATTQSNQIVMQPSAPAAGSGKAMPSPPFAFVSKAAVVPPPMTLSPAATSTATTVGEDVWKCTVCKKAKDLRGAHLNGKNSVRSDCWPCAHKRVFVRYGADDKPIESAAVLPQPTTSTIAASPAVSTVGSVKSTIPPQTPSEPHSTLTLRTNSSFDATPLTALQSKKLSAFTWRDPEVPSVETERQFFVGAVGSATGTSSCNNNAEVSLSSIFYDKTIQAYLANVRSHAFARQLPVTWSSDNTTIYVNCSHFIGPRTVSGVPTSPSALYPALGDVAAILMYIEASVASSLHVGRVFCPDTLSLAGAALYQIHVNRALAIFGPAPDKTTKPVLLDDIIDVLPVQTRVTSGDQRTAAAKSLWSSISMSVMPTAATGEAIRQHEPSVSTSAVDVVLITKTASSDEAGQFRLLIA